MTKLIKPSVYMIASNSMIAAPAKFQIADPRIFNAAELDAMNPAPSIYELFTTQQIVALLNSSEFAAAILAGSAVDIVAVKSVLTAAAAAFPSVIGQKTQ